MKTETLTVPPTVEGLNPVLSHVRCSLRHSEETPFFEAVLTINGQKFVVKNEGRGGANTYWPFLSRGLESALDKLAAANLPKITECGGSIIDPPMDETFEMWTFGIAFDVAEGRNRSRCASLLPLNTKVIA